MNEIINLGNGQYVKVVMLKGESGSNIQSITKTSTSGLVDTYTINLTDGSTHTFTVTNGKGISSITKTGTSGLVDTYTIAFNDNTSQTYTVTNGNGIVSVEKTGTNVLVDTYTITFDSGSPVTFTVTNGKGISSIAKTSTSGLVDTYTITYNDNTTSTFDVTNGANGQDVSQSNLAPVETSSTASQSYAVDDLLIFNGQLYRVIQAIAIGNNLQVNVNITTESISNIIKRNSSYESDEIVIGKWGDHLLYRKYFESYYADNDAHYWSENTWNNVSTFSLATDFITKIKVKNFFGTIAMEHKDNHYLIGGATNKYRTGVFFNEGNSLVNPKVWIYLYIEPGANTRYWGYSCYVDYIKV